MKKIFTLFTAAMLLLLAGCNSEAPADDHDHSVEPAPWTLPAETLENDAISDAGAAIRIAGEFKAASEYQQYDTLDTVIYDNNDGVWSVYYIESQYSGDKVPASGRYLVAVYENTGSVIYSAVVDDYT